MSLRLCGALVDVPRSDHARAVDFWSAALGRTAEVSESFPGYAQFHEVTPGLYFMVQATDGDRPSCHLDFESADRDADVERLIRLGAAEVHREHHWVVLRDVSGVDFCVVQARKPAEQADA